MHIIFGKLGKEKQKHWMLKEGDMTPCERKKHRHTWKIKPLSSFARI